MPEASKGFSSQYERSPTEPAIELAQELDDVSVERGSDMLEAREKMRTLIGMVKRLEGNEAERQISESELVRFRSGDFSSAAFKDLKLDSIALVKKMPRGEELEIIALIDPSTGGSLLMTGEGHVKDIPFEASTSGYGRNDPFHEWLGGWLRDEQFEKDTAYLSRGSHHSNEFTLANRFRELRIAARMVRLLLGTKGRK